MFCRTLIPLDPSFVCNQISYQDYYVAAIRSVPIILLLLAIKDCMIQAFSAHSRQHSSRQRSSYLIINSLALSFFLLPISQYYIEIINTNYYNSIYYFFRYGTHWLCMILGIAPWCHVDKRCSSRARCKSLFCDSQLGGILCLSSAWTSPRSTETSCVK